MFRYRVALVVPFGAVNEAEFAFEEAWGDLGQIAELTPARWSARQ